MAYANRQTAALKSLSSKGLETWVHSFSDRFFLLALALPAALLLGGVVFRFLLLDRPAIFARALISVLERKLNRSNRSTNTLRRRGMLALAMLLAGAIALGFACSMLAEAFRWGMALEVYLMTLMLPARSVLSRAQEVLKAVQAKQISQAAALVWPQAGEKHPADTPAILRIMVESLGLHFSGRIIAPCFWYLLLGLPGMLCVSTLSVMVGLVAARAMQGEAFGCWAVRLNLLAQWLPSRIAALFLALSAVFAPGCSPWRSLRGALRGSGQGVVTNGGAVLGALAGALGVALAEPRLPWHKTQADQWIDYGSAKLEPVHLIRARYLIIYAMGIVVLVAVAANLKSFSPAL